MAEKIQLAQFDFDIDAATQKAADMLKAINAIKEEQKQLVKEGKSTDQAFVRNAVNLRGLQQDYNAQLKVVNQYIQASGRQVSIQERIDAAMNMEVKNINSLRAQNAALIKVRNEVNIETEEGQEQIMKLNAAIDANNELIKANVSELEQQKIGIGGYADAITQALGSTGLFNGVLGDIQGTLSTLSPIFKSLGAEIKEGSSQIRNAAEGTEDLTGKQKLAAVASNLFSGSLKLLKVALIGTGIGAIVVLLGSIVAYLNSSAEASNKFGKVLGVLGGLVQKLMKYLEPLGELLVDGIIKSFEVLGVVAVKALNGISSALSALGFDKAAAGVKSFNDEMQQAAKDADLLTQKEQKLVEAQRRAGIVQLQYQTQAEKLRQLRDDENRSISERIASNEQLGATLREQLKAERAIAIQALEVVNLQIAAKGATNELLDQQFEAMERMVDINERITGQESEQLANRVSLQKEAADQAKAAADAAQAAAQKRVETMNQELALYEAQQFAITRTGEEELKLQEDLSARRLDILKTELKNKLISQQEYDTEVLRMDNEIARQRAELAVENAEREYSQLERRIEVETALSEKVGQAKIDQERKNATILREEQGRLAMIAFNQDLITEQQYLDQVAELNDNFRIREAELDREQKALDDAERTTKAQLDYEAAVLALEAQGATEFEIKAAQIELQRQQNLEAARQQYTDEALLAQAILNVNAQAQQAQVELQKQADKSKLESRLQLLESVAQIVGEETALGKAAAAARTIMTTYETAMSAYNALAGIPIVGPALGAVAAAAVGVYGAKNVAKILSTKTDTSVNTSGIGTTSTSSTQQQAVVSINSVPPFAKGGLVTGGIPIQRSNGDNVLATLKKDEVVLTEDHQAALGGAATFRAIGVPGFATGGVVSAGARTATVQNTFMRNYDAQLAETLGEAVREGAQGGSEAGTRKGFGDVATDNYLNRLSSV